jgi:hypothetical protein
MPYKDKIKQREAQAKWARENRAITNNHRKANRDKNRVKVNKIKESNPCNDCEEHYPFYIMQFDHVNNDKCENIGTLVSKNAAWHKIEKEISKCELVCANCHAERTYSRANS